MNEKKKNKEYYTSQEFLQQRKNFTITYPSVFLITSTILFVLLGGGRQNTNATTKTRGGFDATVTAPTNQHVASSREEAENRVKQQGQQTENIPTDFDVAALEKASKTPKQEEYIYQPPTRKLETSAELDKTYTKNYVYQPPHAMTEIKPSHTIYSANDQYQEVSAPIKKRSEFLDNSNTLSNESNVTTNERTTIIEAVVHGEQKIETANTIVKFRIIKDGYLNGYLIPKNTYIYGVVSGSNANRINISISTIQVGGVILQKNLSVYNYGDDIMGIPTSGGDIKDGANQVADESVDQSTNQVGSGLTSMAISATKSIFRKRRDKISATLYNAHKVFIK